MSSFQTLGLAAAGLINHARRGTCPPEQWESVLRLAWQTNFAVADAVNFVHRSFVPRTRFGATHGALGETSANERSRIVQSIKRDGYYVFPQRVPDSLIDPISNLMTTAFGSPYPPTSNQQRYVYDPLEPLAPLYYYYDLFLPQMQRLMVDETITAVATDYLGVDPILHGAMQWTSAKSLAPSSEAAQMYHFDISNLKWLSFFIYLTNVTTDSGAHCLIKGSHRLRDRLSAPLRRRGVVRYTDQEIAKTYGPERHVEITGKRGTIFCVDTRACHKGRHPISADRRVMQLYYVNSTFGVTAQSRTVPKPIPEFVAAKDRWPRLLHYFSSGVQPSD